MATGTSVRRITYPKIAAIGPPQGLTERAAVRPAMIVHVVLMQWKDRVGPLEIERAKAAYLGLASKVPGITSAYWGRSTERRGAKFQGMAMLVAESRAALDAYNAHPDHAALAKMVDAMVRKFVDADMET
ncbi:MAG TPA: Dabb family protein [Thermoplasmata archaeon]|nr:Dabb family protein [Thermoplasmata archaeon]